MRSSNAHSNRIRCLRFAYNSLFHSKLIDIRNEIRAYANESHRSNIKQCDRFCIGMHSHPHGIVQGVWLHGDFEVLPETGLFLTLISLLLRLEGENSPSC